MKTVTSAISAVATAATLLASGILPASQASAETIFVPELAGKIQPIGPNACATKPWLCGPGGLKLPPPGPGPLPPPPPPAPPAPSGGMSAGTAAAIGVIGGVIAGAVIANANKPQEVYAEPTGNVQAHLSYCFGKYKSYRSSDNTFQPYHGPRKQCYSPYI